MLACSGSLLVGGGAKKPNVARLIYGKKQTAVHQTSGARPSAVTLLTNAPDSKIAATVQHALRTRELSESDVVSVLKFNRAFRRFDRSEALVAALRREGQQLSSYHYAVLMAHANDLRDTGKALQLWQEAVREGRANEKLHGAVLAAHRNAGHWREALQHCAAMWEDKMVLDPHAMHAVMNACRRCGPWHAGLSFFSAAVAKGSAPNAVVYLELLRLISAARFPQRWRQGLAVLRALEDKVELTAGHYNAVLGTMGGAGWRRGVALFEEMKARNVSPSTDTLQTLLLLRADSLSHCISCVAEAHALGLPVTDTMYRATLSNLFRLGLDHEASLFLEREYAAEVAEASSSTRSSLNASVALLDSLLAHPRPRRAIVLLESFEGKLGDVVTGSTLELGAMGSLSQRWLVQGRVAVADHNVVLSPNFESLAAHYDSVFVPFSSVRLLVRRNRESAGSTRGRYIYRALRNVQRVLREQRERVFRVVPLAHQLQAHTYLVGGPTSSQSLAELHAEAQKRFPSFSQQLLESLDTVSAAEGEEETASRQRQLTQEDPHATIQIRTDDKASQPPRTAGDTADNALFALGGSTTPPSRGGKPSSSPSPSSSDDAKTAAVVTRLQFPHFADRLTSAERTLAVAAMLKSLNPDSDVHVLSNNAAQLRLVSDWTADRPLVPITPVRYPEELFRKAPPAAVPGTRGYEEELAASGETSAEGETDDWPSDELDDAAFSNLPLGSPS